MWCMGSVRGVHVSRACVCKAWARVRKCVHVPRVFVCAVCAQGPRCESALGLSWEPVSVLCLCVG